MKQLSKSLLLMLTFVVSVIAVIFNPESLQAATSESVAKTPPPPLEMSIEGYFDPSYKYLDQGDSTIIDKGNRTAQINVTTIAKQTVASIGATIYLEKWTGTAWITVSTTPASISENNTSYFDGYAIMSTASGYYYRARTLHWVSHNGVYEQGERVTNAILAK